MNVTLIGMPGAGKSSVGRRLARRLQYAFLDVDPLIVDACHGSSLQEVLDRLGNEGLLDAEAEVIAGLTCENTVIAPGGSAVLREKGILHLKELGPVVYLKPSTETLLRRLRNLAIRGVTLAPGQSVQDLYAYRAPFYEKYADLTVDSDQLQIQDTVELIVKELREL